MGAMHSHYLPHLKAYSILCGQPMAFIAPTGNIALLLVVAADAVDDVLAPDVLEVEFMRPRDGGLETPFDLMVEADDEDDMRIMVPDGATTCGLACRGLLGKEADVPRVVALDVG